MTHTKTVEQLLQAMAGEEEHEDSYGGKAGKPFTKEDLEEELEGEPGMIIDVEIDPDKWDALG
jgi:hypothetical protein